MRSNKWILIFLLLSLIAITTINFADETDDDGFDFEEPDDDEDWDDIPVEDEDDELNSEGLT